MEGSNTVLDRRMIREEPEKVREALVESIKGASDVLGEEGGSDEK